MSKNHQVHVAANEAYERWRARARDTLGRRLKGNSKPYAPPELPDGTINVSDSDSRVMRTQGTPPRQAYNAQTAVNDKQIILAAEITVDAPDFGHFGSSRLRCPIEAGALGRLADHECGHGRLPFDRTPPCGCWPEEGAVVLALPSPSHLAEPGARAA